MKYEQSPFGKMSGTIAGQVAGSWKGIKYSRGYVVPANPDTDDQKKYRGIFKNIAEYGRELVNTILNVYQVPAPKRMSAYNYFVSVNTKLQTSAVFNPALVKILSGSLYNGGITGLTAASGTGNITVEWDDVLIGSAKATDIAVVAAYDRETLKWYFSVAETRVDSEAVISTSGGLSSSDNIDAYLAFCSADLLICSDSDYSTAVVS